MIIIGAREMMPPILHGAIPTIAADKVKPGPGLDLDRLSQLFRAI
jgi:hypothetical protein